MAEQLSTKALTVYQALLCAGPELQLRLAVAIEALADQADPKRHVEDISYQHQAYVDGWKDCLEVIRNIAAELRSQDQLSSEEL